MSKPLSSSDIKHLCRLLGWVECEIGPDLAELRATLADVANKTGVQPDAEAQARLVAAYRKAESVPKYVRAAVKALRKATADQPGEVIDAVRSDWSMPTTSRR